MLKFFRNLEERIDGPAETSRTIFFPIILGILSSLVVIGVLFIFGVVK